MISEFSTWPFLTAIPLEFLNRFKAIFKIQHIYYLTPMPNLIGNLLFEHLDIFQAHSSSVCEKVESQFFLEKEFYLKH